MRWTGSRRDNGAVAVETALIVPLILIPLVLGTIELTLWMRDYIAAVSLSRAGARVASAEPRLASFVDDAVDAMERSASTLPWDTVQEIWVYEANEQGFPGEQGSFESCTEVANCVRFSWVDPDNDGPLPGSVSKIGGTWDAAEVNACLNDVDNTSVGVYVRARHTWVAASWVSAFFTRDGGEEPAPVVESATVMRFEPVSMPPRPGETNPNLLSCE